MPGLEEAGPPAEQKPTAQGRGSQLPRLTGTAGGLGASVKFLLGVRSCSEGRGPRSPCAWDFTASLRNLRQISCAPARPLGRVEDRGHS